MDKIDEMLEFLAGSSASHDLDEVSRLLGISSELCLAISRFLAKYGFIRLEGRDVRISSKTLDFILTTSPAGLIETSSESCGD